LSLADMRAGIGPFLGVSAGAWVRIATSVIKYWEVFPVQAPDGIGAGLQSVAVPGLVARILMARGGYMSARVSS
jgi:hypothetical protein